MENLNKIEREVTEGSSSLNDLGFWKIVSQVKQDTFLIDEFADQIGRIDGIAFGNKHTMSLRTGNLLNAALTFLALIFLYLGAIGPKNYPHGALLLTSAILFSVAPHSLTHFLVGKVVGIDFLYYFLNGAAKVEPTLKTDYASYLRASPQARAVMHVSAAAISTLLPLTVLGVAIIYNAPRWSVQLLALLCAYVLIIEALPFVCIIRKKWRMLGLDFRKTDVGRAYRELRLWRRMRNL
jgi:hypothetical protein